VGSIPASRTNQPFFNVSERLKTRMFIGIAGFLLTVFFCIIGFQAVHKQPTAYFDALMAR